MADNVSAKTWVNSCLSASEMVSFAIPEVGPVLAAGEAVVQFLLDMFWPSSGTPVDPLQQAINQAQTDLSSALNIDIANIDDLLDYMSKQEQDDLKSNEPAQHQGVYKQLSDAVEHGNTSLIPSQLRNMENVMLSSSPKWRERFLILNAYLAGVGVDLLIHSQLILVDALVGNVPNALKSGKIQDLADETTLRTGKLNQAISLTNTGLLNDMKQAAEGAWGWMTGPNPNPDVTTEASMYEMFKGAVILGGPVFGPESTEYTDAIVKMSNALSTSNTWQQQAQGWVHAASQVP